MGSPEQRPKTSETGDEHFTPEEKAELYLQRAQYLVEQRGVDVLTDLKNRIGFDQALTSALERHKGEIEQHHRATDETGAEVAVLFLDLDNFKRVNDTYGHLEGDAVLREVARVLTHSVRGDEDIVARFGGDEFYILLPRIKKADAVKVGDKILANLHANAKLSSYDIGASIGISATDVTMDPEPLVKFADEAAKVSKNNGKNQVSVYTPLL